MPEHTPRHAHTDKRIAHRADFELIRNIALPADGRWLPMLNTTELEKRELRRVDIGQITLHDLIIVASEVPNPILPVVVDAGCSSVHDYLKLKAVSPAWNRGIVHN